MVAAIQAVLGFNRIELSVQECKGVWDLYSCTVFVCLKVKSYVCSSVSFFFKKEVIEKTTQIIQETIPILQVLLEKLDRKVDFINNYLNFVGLSRQYNRNFRAGLAEEVKTTLAAIVETPEEIGQKVDSLVDLITPHVEAICEVVTTLTNL